MVKIAENKAVKRDNASNLCFFIYGSPQIGKTHFAANTPNPIIFNTDGNIKNITTPNQTFETWTQFVQQIAELINNKEKYGYETIILDLLDDLLELCRVHYLKELNIKHESDLGYGKAYTTIRQNFVEVLDYIKKSGYNVVMISHEESIIDVDELGRTITKFKPSLPAKVTNKISRMSDITGRASIIQEEKDGESVRSRVLQVYGDKSVMAGNRITNLENINMIYLDYDQLIKTIKGK